MMHRNTMIPICDRPNRPVGMHEPRPRTAARWIVPTALMLLTAPGRPLERPAFAQEAAPGAAPSAAQGPAPSVAEVAQAIRKGLGSVKQLHVKLTVSSTSHLAIEPNAQKGYGLHAERDEFAVSGPKQFRDRRYWNRNRGRGKHDTWTQQLCAFDGTNSAYLLVQCTPPNPPETHEASLVPEYEDSYIVNSNIYLESIGSPYYDGPKLSVWFRHPRKTPAYPFSLPAALEARPYRVRPEREPMDGALCWVVEFPGQDTLWLDPERGFALIRRDWNYGVGEPAMFRYHNSGLREVSPGAWLPTRVRREVMASPKDSPDHAGQCMLTNVCNVATMAVDNLPESLFAYRFAPGTEINDGTRLPAKAVVAGNSRTKASGKPEIQYVMYEVGATAEETQEQLEAALAYERAQASPVARNWLLVALNLAAVGATFVGYRVYKSRKAGA